MMLTVEEYMAFRRLIDSERESEGATLASADPAPVRRKVSTYNRKYRAAFKKVSSTYKLKSALPAAGTVMDAGDNTQLGWAFYATAAEIAPTAPDIPAVAPSYSGFFNQLIDPDHIINRDLFISLRNSTNATFNYLVVCEFMELTDDEAIVTIIKENSQSIE
eukprot:gene25531-4289_t